MKRLATSTVALVILTGGLLTACGDPFSPESVSGTYNLETLNGNSLPTSSVDGTQITAGSITLNSDGTMNFSLGFQLQPGVTITVDLDGTYTLVEPSTVRMTVEGDLISGTLDGDRLTVVGEDGDRFVYRR